MTETIPLHEAEGHLGELVERALHGEDIVLTRDGRPAVTIAPAVPDASASTRPVRFGLLKGRIWIADDFDAPLPDDILKGFYGVAPDEPWPQRPGGEADR